MNRVLYYISCLILFVSFWVYILSFFGLYFYDFFVILAFVSIFLVWFFALKELNRRMAIKKEQNLLIEKKESFFEAHKTMRKDMISAVFQGVPIWAKRTAIFIFYAAIVSFLANLIFGILNGGDELSPSYLSRLASGHAMAFAVISAVVLYPPSYARKNDLT